MNWQMTANQYTIGPRPEIELSFIKPIGLCLNQAPYIDASSFVGRAAEIEHMHHILRPEENLMEQHRLVLGGWNRQNAAGDCIRQTKEGQLRHYTLDGCHIGGYAKKQL